MNRRMSSAAVELTHAQLELPCRKAGLKTRLYFNLMTTSEMSSVGRPNARTSFLIAS